MTKKNLFIFFGEYRTFETIIKKIKGLDKFDVLFSTWDYCYVNGKITKHKIEKACDYCVPIISTDADLKSFATTINPDMTSDDYFYSSTKMLYHIRLALNSVNIDEYDWVIIHRCDLISNITDVNFSLLDDETVYMSPGHTDENGFFMGDYAFMGNIKTIKSYIELIPFTHYPLAHYFWGNVILENNIKYDDFVNVHKPASFELIKPHMIFPEHND